MEEEGIPAASLYFVSKPQRGNKPYESCAFQLHNSFRLVHIAHGYHKFICPDDITLGVPLSCLVSPFLKENPLALDTILGTFAFVF